MAVRASKRLPVWKLVFGSRGDKTSVFVVHCDKGFLFQKIKVFVTRNLSLHLKPHLEVSALISGTVGCRLGCHAMQCMSCSNGWLSYAAAMSYAIKCNFPALACLALNQDERDDLST